MSIPRVRRPRRPPTHYPFVLVLGFAVLLLAPVLNSVAQVIPIQAQPTGEPEGPIRVPPTEEPELPIAVPPTDEPPAELPPERVAPEEPATDVPAPEPTQEPALAPLPEDPPHSLFIVKRECPAEFDRESERLAFPAECTNLVMPDST